MTRTAATARSSLPDSIDLLQVEPELFAGADPCEVAEAGRASVLWLDVGRWEPGVQAPAPAGHFGLLVLEGILLRRAGLPTRDGVELLGPGDILRPWVAASDFEELAARPVWSVQKQACLAVLDEDFAARVARWPSVAGEIMDRLVRRQHALAIQLSITHMPNLQARLRLMLWSLAGRWGRVTPDGVRVDLPLTHQLLADLSGASRPPVTTALGQLERDGWIRRGGTGRYVLRGMPIVEPAPSGRARRRAGGHRGLPPVDGQPLRGPRSSRTAVSGPRTG